MQKTACHEFVQNKDKKRYLEKEREKLTKQLDSLTAEIAKALSGNSKFDTDTLSVAITNTKENLRETDAELAECIRKIEKQFELMEGIDGKYNLFRSWADLYDKATLEIRKMIACQLITRVEVKRGYELSVYLNPSFAQFLGKEAVENLTPKKNKAC